MKHFFQVAIAFLFIFLINNDIVAQKKTKQKMTSFDFEFQGEKFLIQKGTRIHIGMGSAEDGSFNYIEFTKHISGNNWKEVNMDKSNSNKDATVVGMKYYKATDYLWLNIQIDKGGYFSIQLQEAILKKEIIGIDDYFFDNSNAANSKNITNQTKSVTNNLTHILKLKNGSEIKCRVLEFKPTQTIKIETFDGSIFVYTVEEIEELVVNESSTSNIKNKPSEYTNSSIKPNYEEVERKKGAVLQKDSSINRFYNGIEVSASFQLPDLYEYRLNSSWPGFGVKYTAGYQLNHYLMLGANLGLNVHLGPNFQKEIQNTDGFVVGYIGLAQKVSLLGKKKVSPEIGFNENLGSLISHDGRIIFDFETNLGVRLKTDKALTYRVSVGYGFQHLKFSYVRNSLRYNGPFKAQHIKLNFGVNF